MLQLLVDTPRRDRASLAAAATAPDDYGIWTDHRIPDDRSDWHPLVRQFYEYWLSIRPPGLLPGRRQLRPERIGPLLSRLWMMDVQREPLRFRFRLCGTEMVRSLRREVTGAWLDEAQPQSVGAAVAQDRFRLMVERGVPTWRRGPVLWNHDANRRTLENCIVPLAGDGRTVDILFAIVVTFDADGHQF